MLGSNQQQTSNHNSALNDERIQPHSEGDDSEIEILHQNNDSTFKGVNEEEAPLDGNSSLIDAPKSIIMTESHQL